jgi:hypothetical protein
MLSELETRAPFSSYRLSNTKIHNKNYIQNSTFYFRARFRCDRFRSIAFYTHYIESGTLLYPISCRWLFGEVGNMVKTISAHSQIIPHALQTAVRDPVNSLLNLSSKTSLCAGCHLAIGRIHCNAVSSGLVSWIDKIQNAFKS